MNLIVSESISHVGFSSDMRAVESDSDPGQLGPAERGQEIVTFGGSLRRTKQMAKPWRDANGVQRRIPDNASSCRPPDASVVLPRQSQAAHKDQLNL
jgi:hypothetical protein